MSERTRLKTEEKKTRMSLDSLLASKPWILAVERGYKYLPLSDTVYYKYTFHFSQEKNETSRIKGYVIVESCTSNGRFLMMRDGVNQKRVMNPFVLIYSGKQNNHAILKCTKLHAKGAQNEDKKRTITYDCQINPPILFNCQRKKGKSLWEISGSMYDVRAFFTPNLSFHDHFGYLSILTSKVMIHVSPEEMSFHMLTHGSYEIVTCRTVDENKIKYSEDEDPEDELDLESQLLGLQQAEGGHSSSSALSLSTSPSTSTSTSTIPILAVE